MRYTRAIIDTNVCSYINVLVTIQYTCSFIIKHLEIHYILYCIMAVAKTHKHFKLLQSLWLFGTTLIHVYFVSFKTLRNFIPPLPTKLSSQYVCYQIKPNTCLVWCTSVKKLVSTSSDTNCWSPTMVNNCVCFWAIKTLKCRQWELNNTRDESVSFLTKLFVLKIDLDLNTTCLN